MKGNKMAELKERPTVNRYDMHEFLRDIGSIIRQVHAYNATAEHPINSIIGISRGGLIPAVYLSHYLNLPMRVVEYSTRDGMVGETSHAWLSTVRNALVVDDIADSGRTLNYIQDVNPFLPTAVLIQKELSDHMATFHGKYESGVSWVQFPWELAP